MPAKGLLRIKESCNVEVNEPERYYGAENWSVQGTEQPSNTRIEGSEQECRDTCIDHDQQHVKENPYQEDEWLLHVNTRRKLCQKLQRWIREKEAKWKFGKPSSHHASIKNRQEPGRYQWAGKRPLLLQQFCFRSRSEQERDKLCLEQSSSVHEGCGQQMQWC